MPNLNTLTGYCAIRCTINGKLLCAPKYMHTAFVLQDDEIIIDEQDDDDDVPVERTPIAGHGLLKRTFHPGSASMGSAQRGEKAERENAMREKHVMRMIDENRLRDAKKAGEGAKDRVAGKENASVSANSLKHGLHAVALSLAPDAIDFRHQLILMQDEQDARDLKKQNINE